MLDDAGIGAEQQPDVKHCGSERPPTEQLVTAQLEGPDGAAPRPHRQHAENEASGNRAQTEDLRELPGHSG